jgi:2,4-dienoyl-CoA reductase (NADPH2)
MKLPGEKKLQALFQPGKIGGLASPNRIKFGACCVSNYNTRDGYITAPELARMKVIAETGRDTPPGPRSWPAMPAAAAGSTA